MWGMQNLSRKTRPEIPVTAASKHFDYDGLSLDDADQLRQLAGKVQAIGRRQTGLAVETGQALITAKARLEHRKFSEWCRYEAGLQPRTAQLLISLAKLVAKTPELIDLPVSVGYLLAAPSTPRTVIPPVLAAVKRGDRVTVAWVEELIREAKGKGSKTERNNSNSDVAKIAKMIGSALEPGEITNLRKLLEAAGESLIAKFVCELQIRLEDELGETGAVQFFAVQAQEHIAAL